MVTALLTNVPDVGRVTLVLAVAVKVVLNAPLVVRFPPNVMVLLPLFTPVPPYVPLTRLPFQVPDVMVPNVVIDVCPTYVGSISTTTLPVVGEQVIKPAVPATLVTPVDDDSKVAHVVQHHQSQRALHLMHLCNIL